MLQRRILRPVIIVMIIIIDLYIAPLGRNFRGAGGGECVCGRGSAPNPAGGAYSAPLLKLAALHRAPRFREWARGNVKGYGWKENGGGRKGRERENGGVVEFISEFAALALEGKTPLNT